jgi:hypothetical protein
MTNHGRTYLTMLSDAELVRTALDRDHELAVVLAERLSELLDRRRRARASTDAIRSQQAARPLAS